MDAKYDAFYAERQYPVTFSECALGQVLATEGALGPVVWQAEWDKWSYET
jgi:N-acetylglucosamine-6-sulfatase